MNRFSLVVSALWVLVSTIVGGDELRTERCLVYTVERIAPEAAPRVDGKLNEAVWGDRPAIDTLRNFLGERVGDFASQKSAFTILTDGANLYIGAVFHEPEMKKIQANPALPPYSNDCIEVYFDPRHDGTRKIQFVIDCIGQKWRRKHFNDGYGWVTDSAWEVLADWEARTSWGDNAWYVEIRVNGTAFGFDPQPGEVVGFNVCRFRLGAGNEFSAWGFEGSGRQKNMAAWGHLLFAKPGESVADGAVTSREIEQIYPDLSGLRVQVPIAGGFQIYTTDGMEERTFGELLAPLVAELRALLQEGETVLANLGVKGKRRESLAGAFAAGREKTRELLSTVESVKLTCGAYDRLVAAIATNRKGLENTIGQMKLARLVARVNPTPKTTGTKQ
ncbi:MAG: hypothetical protein K9N51_01700 [Candidatus Pacebacteria bacterium]|nr:hypothetical protein [Candidatus Paceibacterota bacterium]